MNELTVIGNYDRCRECGCMIHKGSKWGLCERHEREFLDRVQRLKEKSDKKASWEDSQPKDSSKALPELHDCGGRIEEQIYRSHGGEWHMRIVCGRCRREIAWCTLCPDCGGVLREAGSTTSASDCEYTRYECSICGRSLSVCTFEPEN